MAAFESKFLRVTFEKDKVLVSSSITKDGLCKSKVDPCGLCNLRLKANSVLCVLCGKWIHGKCAGVKKSDRKVFKKSCLLEMERKYLRGSGAG